MLRIKQQMIKITILLTIMAVFSFFTTSLFADDKNNNQIKPVHPLAQNLSNIGAFSCAERANQIGSFLTGNTEPDIVLQTPKDNPNNRLLMSTLVVSGNKKSAISSISLAPNQVNGCGGSYHAINYSNQSCAQTILDNFKEIKFQLINKTDVQIGVVNRALWIIALPAGSGCVIFKEEVLE